MLKEHKHVAHVERVIQIDTCNFDIFGVKKIKTHKQMQKQKE